MKNTNKKLNNQLKIVKASFTGSNITKFSGLNTVAKYMNRGDGLVKALLKLDKAINENAISATLKMLGQNGARPHLVQNGLSLYVQWNC